MINDDLETAFGELKTVIETKKQDPELNKKGADLVEDLKTEFQNAQWKKLCDLNFEVLSFI